MATKDTYSASTRVRPRRDGTIAYDVRFRLDSRSRSLSFETQRAADKWAAIVRKIGPGPAIEYLNLATKEGSPTIDQYADTYITGKSGIEAKTSEHYRMYMRLHISPTLGHLPVDAVCPDAVAAWINLMTTEGWSGKSIKNWHGYLAAMFQNAVHDGLITNSPCARSRLPETEQVEMVFLSPDEFTHLLSYVPIHSQALVLFLASTGLRWGEATALRPADFDVDQRLVRVSRAWKYSAEKGWYIGPPKTKRSKRTVSMPVELVTTLRPIIATAKEYVFTTLKGAPVRQQRFYEWSWNPARRLANGLPAFDKSKADPDREWSPRSNGTWDRQPASKPMGKTPRVHDLRHSHASWLLASGVGIDVVSRRLGHESVKTTLDVYGHISPERAEEAGDITGVILAGAMPQLEVAANS